MTKWKKKRLAKCGLIVIAIMFAVVIIFLAIGCPAHAERNVSLKDGMLIVRAEVMRVRGIPKEISDPELALKFITGQLSEAVISGKGEVVSYSLFPFVNTKYKYSDKVVTYYGGTWLVTPMPNRIKVFRDYAYTFSVWMIIMSIVMVVAKIAWLTKKRIKKGRRVMLN